jgi:hypothetical protein
LELRLIVGLQPYAATLKHGPAASKLVTQDVDPAIVAPYTVKWPDALPGSQLPLKIAASGLLVPEQLQTADIADGSITKAKMATSAGQQISSSSGAYSTSSGSYVDVTNLTVTITTTGRPVMLALIGDGSGLGSTVGNIANASSSGIIRLLRGATVMYDYLYGHSAYFNMPPGAFKHFDPVAAGTYTYKIQAKVDSGAVAVYVQYCKLFAWEISV